MSEFEVPRSMDEQPPRELIIEVGAGHHPFATTPGRRRLRDDQDYVAVDRYDTFAEDSLTRLEAGMQVAEEAEGGTRRMREGDATKLPFADGTVNEVVFTNFFGDRRNRPAHQASVAEAVRVLKPGTGVVTVVETYSPGEMPLAALCGLFARYNLLQINSGKEDDQYGITLYSDPRSDNSAYIARFIQMANPEQPQPQQPENIQHAAIDPGYLGSEASYGGNASVQDIINTVRRAKLDMETAQGLTGKAYTMAKEAFEKAHRTVEDTENQLAIDGLAHLAAGRERLQDALPGFQAFFDAVDAYLAGITTQ